ncbi:Wadjet anti-phage system protein JetD domain-containing protein [Desulfitobacterium hafniense]|uniref:Wadjet protein JetD C-terminal domain-containing protein n=3 Tax=Desulfitobacterium hafniense TaxID=49338 RepID=Q24ZP2_DESHY|nr:Wadjet anti-phage system protein JetD domain-containing protein [Desulfitobacterium hafniense]ACL18736.1 conserved hypothetical protein [Desulfitobacterium hafniense DCB-2]KTE89104.1 hypothetical protein AT727_13845 [Desulfitobacterium hafniense]BAE82500.1 hypothetical protein DSY0711 [Desulfitobacterium hafniense Y51]CDX00706.1 DNA topoisomerase VI, subunit A [Desulfitobacterium hafniense]
MEDKEVREYKKKILTLLLRKYQNSLSFQTGTPGKQRPQLTMAKSELAADYEDELDFRKREWIHAALKELSREGIIQVTWPKLKEHIQVHKVYLNFAGVERAYQLLGETPLEDKLRRLKESLSPLAAHPWVWVRSWQRETCARLEERKSAGLDADNPQGYDDLVKVLKALPELEDSTPKRVFSQSLFQDSKYFEKKLEGRLISLLRKIYPEELDQDEDYLDQVGIVNNPKLTLLAGPLIIHPDRDLSHFSGGLGLSAQSVKELIIQDIPAQTILLIENLTTYHEVLQAPPILPAPVLAIYTGGFPHKSAQKLLEKVSGFLENRRQGQGLEIFHWGDIDYGGIRIFEYLRRNFFPNLKPYRMDGVTYLEYESAGLPFGEDQAKKLAALLSDPGYSDWHEVIGLLLSYRKRVEQEGIRVG